MYLFYLSGNFSSKVEVFKMSDYSLMFTYMLAVFFVKLERRYFLPHLFSQPKISESPEGM